MPRPIRAGGLSPLSLALCLSLSGVLAGCGDQAADESVPPGGGPTINPAEPGQTSIPETETETDQDATNLGREPETDVPVIAEPEAPGIGS
ncbi:hypothetical protein [Tautonia rosea]|uniref:hypothetical protein n=1 Tax=Tautonia rosea TaxID=2728037 RepID=UPI0014727E04|nr:hypothetical protein [Tautonia rosea]